MKIHDYILPHNAALKSRVISQTCAVVVHTTGSGILAAPRGPIAQGLTVGTEAFDDAVVAWYKRSGHKEFGHYLVGTSGKVYQFAQDHKRAWHSATVSNKYRLGKDVWQRYALHPVSKLLVEHGRDPAAVYDWWNARWDKYRIGEPPLLFGDRTRVHPNAYTVAIDLVPTPHRAPLYTDAQYEATKTLLAHIGSRFGIDVSDPRKVVGHADIDPMRRGIVNKGGKLVGVDWDPGKLDWERLR